MLDLLMSSNSVKRTESGKMVIVGAKEEKDNCLRARMSSSSMRETDQTAFQTLEKKENITLRP